MLQVGDGGFIAGRTISMADIAFFPILALLVRQGLEFEKFPRLGKYHAQMCERPSVKATWPPHWKEAAGNPPLKQLFK